MRILSLLSLWLTYTRPTAGSNDEASLAWTEAVAGCEAYTVQLGDSCVGIARSVNATFAQIVAWNADLINFQCTNLAELYDNDICVSNPEGDYAIPRNDEGSHEIVTTTAPVPEPTPNESEGRCAQWHFVEEGQDCGDFTNRYGITLKDFVFLNPHVWENCTNVWKDYYYCVRPVGYISTYPGYMPPTTTKEFTETPSTPLPESDEPNPLEVWLEREREAEAVIPLGNRTRRDCEHYVFVGDFDETPTLANCWDLAQIYDLSREEFVLWNPSLAQTPAVEGSHEYDYPCTIQTSVSYCVALESATAEPVPDTVAPPSPRASGEIEGCTFWARPRVDDSCSRFLARNLLSLAQLYQMNPSVSADCTALTVGTYYCVSTEEDGMPPPSEDDGDDGGAPSPSGTAIPTPRPIQDGMTTMCDQFYLVKSGDGCWDIANDNKIALDDFYAWNPAVKTDCTGLQADVHVCVGVHSAATTTPPETTTTTAGTGISTPTPTQDGMAGNCGDFYRVRSGDGCWAIANDNNISLDDFYSWNPAVKTDCTGLQPDVYVCIGLSGNVQPPPVTTTTSGGTGATPSPVQDGMVSGCKTFYRVVPGDGCWAIADTHGIPLDDFYSWNPAVKTDCSGLQANVYVCTGV